MADSEVTLIANLQAQRPVLQAALDAATDHWGYEDPIYRYYHQSYKVYALQHQTQVIVQTLEALLPGGPLSARFLEIVDQGTGRRFTPDGNTRWTTETRPILEAFFHARYFLEMAVRYASLAEPPSPLPSGYAALLSLYNLR